MKLLKKKPILPERFVYLENDLLHIKFPPQWDLIAKVKTLSGRKFDKSGPLWTTKFCEENIKKLCSWEFRLSRELRKWKNNRKNPLQIKSIKNIPGFNAILKNFQRDGVAFYEARNGKVLNADDMGLGKTYQTLAWLQLRQDARPAIICCPATAKYMWAEKAEELMTGVTVQIINGKNPVKIYGDIVIINYNILAVTNTCPKCSGNKILKKDCRVCRKTGKKVSLRPDLANINWKSVTADEFHMAGNNKSQMGWAFEILAKKAKHVQGLTGTPLENQILELFPIIKMIDSTIFPSWWKFAHRYCDPKHNGFGWNFTGQSNVNELYKKLRGSVMIRRKKTEVLKELPGKIRSVIPIEINKASYNRELAATENLPAIERLTALRQAAAFSKIKECIKWIEEFLRSGEKLVIFAHHKVIIEELYNKFQNKCVVIDGSKSPKQRRQSELKFQNDPNCTVFIGNLKAASVALTLTAAANSVTIEFSFKTSDHEQAEDRINRMTQTRHCTNYYLVAMGTVEEDLIQIIDKKQCMTDQVLDGKVNEKNTIQYLLKKLENKR